MSQQNVETVREAFAAFNRGDPEAAARALHEGVEWIPYLGVFQGSVYRGRAAVLKLWKDINENLGGSALRIEPVEMIDCGDRVVAVVEARGTGTGSGVEVRQGWVLNFSLRDGLIVRAEPHDSREAALQAAELRE